MKGREKRHREEERRKRKNDLKKKKKEKRMAFINKIIDVECNVKRYIIIFFLSKFLYVKIKFGCNTC